MVKTYTVQMNAINVCSFIFQFIKKDFESIIRWNGFLSSGHVSSFISIAVHFPPLVLCFLFSSFFDGTTMIRTIFFLNEVNQKCFVQIVNSMKNTSLNRRNATMTTTTQICDTNDWTPLNTNAQLLFFSITLKMNWNKKKIAYRQRSNEINLVKFNTNWQ